MPVATPRPAATVVVVRDATDASGFDVLMVRRNDQVAFMAGAYVFPGGRVDDEDQAAAARASITGASSRFPSLTAEQELSFRLAAVRELEEETGVRIEGGALEPLAHWVTPELETRRYDTCFFLVQMPKGQEPTHDGCETTALCWLSPRDAIDRARCGEIMLPPPTWTTLKQLARFESIDQVFAWARRTPIVRVQPNLIRDGTQTLLTLPGDPQYPALDGWEVPEDTRFVLQEGRWRPVPA